MTHLSKNLLVVLCATLLTANGCTRPAQISDQIQTYPLRFDRTIAVDQAKLRVQVASTAEERVRGLSSLPGIQPDEGMLFPYSPPSQPNFWMKDMLFPIDIIWIHNGRVVHIHHRVQPPSSHQLDTELARYASPENIDTVLEVQAGWADTHGIHAGSSVID